MNWRCKHCGRIHTQNPKQCRQCGHEILRPVSDAEIEREGSGAPTPEPMDTDDVQTYGRTEPEYQSAPDVALDGSIRREETDSRDGSQGLLARVRQWLRRRLP